MVDFSLTHPLTGFFAPTRFEADVTDCVVVGMIPADLDGAFFRIHGDWIYPPKDADEAVLSADGYISCFRFRNGSVDYRGRFVKTERYQQQIAARRQLYGRYRNPMTDEPQVRDLERPGRRTSANTAPVILAGKLYAAKEEGLPYEIDPNTLETLGERDFGEAWGSQTFSAHPKLDPATGETFAYGYEATGLASKDVYLCTFDPAGKITWEVRFEVPFTTMLHDIAITKDYVIMPGGGTVTSLERLKDGRHHWGWDTNLRSYYAIIPRGGAASDIRWFEGPQRSMVHTANAWNDEDTLTLDAPMANGNEWPWFEDVDGAPFRMNVPTLRRLTFDLRGNSAEPREELLFDQDVTSFTRIDERFAGRPSRYIYVQYRDKSRPFELPPTENGKRVYNVNCYGRFDTVDRTFQAYYVGPNHVLQEPIFVPRSVDAPEGEGYIIGSVQNLKEFRTELVLVDAVTMEELARVLLPFRNADQVHGCWGTAETLPLV